MTKRERRQLFSISDRQAGDKIILFGGNTLGNFQFYAAIKAPVRNAIAFG